MNYDKLNGKEAVDAELLKEYVAAKQELTTIEARYKYLDRLLNKNKKLEEHIWRDANGKIYAISDLKDDHLINIVKLLRSKSTRIPASIEDEIYRRKLETRLSPLELSAGDEIDLLDDLDW